MTGQEQALLEKIADDVVYVRSRVDALEQNQMDLRVSVEHRVTRLEVRASIVAFLISAAVSLVAAALTR